MTEQKITFLQGDCLELLPAVPESSVDLVVTSPPYNIGTAYSSYKDKQDRSEFLAWCRDWATKVRTAMKEDGSFFLNVGASPSNPLLPAQLLLALADGPDPVFALQNTFHWVKSVSVTTRKGETLSVGHFKPINSKRFVNDCHEYVYHLTKTGKVELDRKAAGVPYQDKSNIGRWGHTGGQDLRCRGNVWVVPYETIQRSEKDRPHPATFPVELVERCILLHGKDKVASMLDPFVGIGSSALAARNKGIPAFTGIDLDAGYLEVAKRRLGTEA